MYDQQHINCNFTVVNFDIPDVVLKMQMYVYYNMFLSKLDIWNIYNE